MCQAFFVRKGHCEGKASYAAKIHEQYQDDFCTGYKMRCDTGAHADCADSGYYVKYDHREIQILLHGDQKVAATASSIWVVNTAAALETASSSRRRLKILTPSVRVSIERR